MRIVDFTDLIVWQKAHQLVLVIYRITNKFPSYEKLGLASQMQRATVSTTSNIAEGFVRRSRREKLQFYYIALSSLSELRNQILISKDLNYINVQTYNLLDTQLIEVRKILSGLVKSSNNYSN